MTRTYIVTTFDVCWDGMNRLRSQDEFILGASVAPSTRAKDIQDDWLWDMAACERSDGFDYDACRAAIDKAMDDYVRPAFRAKRWNPFDVPRVGRDGETVTAWHYISEQIL